MDKKFIPYVLPVITIFGLILLAFLNPNITGFATGGENSKDVVNATIRIFTSQGIVLPADSLVIVYLDDKSTSMSVERFVRQSGGQYEYKEGEFPQIEYRGPGYTGNFNYFLELQDFGLGEVPSKATHDLRIVIMYKGKVVSESYQKVKRS